VHIFWRKICVVLCLVLVDAYETRVSSCIEIWCSKCTIPSLSVLVHGIFDVCCIRMLIVACYLVSLNALIKPYGRIKIVYPLPFFIHHILLKHIRLESSVYDCINLRV
jgi:hypothetical protein